MVSKEMKGTMIAIGTTVFIAIVLIVPRQFVAAIADERIEKSDIVDRIKTVEKDGADRKTKIAVLETRLDAIDKNLTIIGTDIKTLIARD